MAAYFAFLLNRPDSLLCPAGRVSDVYSLDRLHKLNLSAARLRFIGLANTSNSRLGRVSGRVVIIADSPGSSSCSLVCSGRHRILHRDFPVAKLSAR